MKMGEIYIEQILYKNNWVSMESFMFVIFVTDDYFNAKNKDLITGLIKSSKQNYFFCLFEKPTF